MDSSEGRMKDLKPDDVVKRISVDKLVFDDNTIYESK